MLYNQCFFYGKAEGGLAIRNVSEGSESDFKPFAGKYKEFEDDITEYVEYKNGCYGYVAVKTIDQGYVSRYNTLNQIFVPCTKSDLSNPYNYIRYMYPYYYLSLKEPKDKAESKEIGDIKLNYNELLGRYGFMGDSGVTKLARFLEMIYMCSFRDITVTVSLDDEKFDISSENNCYKTAAEIMLLAHLLVPDCFDRRYNSVERIRTRLKYSVVRTSEHKSGFCFVPKSSVSGIKSEIYDLNETYSDYSEKSFYYALAEQALKSQKEMSDFLNKLCEIAGVEKFSCRQENLKHMALEQLLTAYRSAPGILKLETSKELINWKSSEMENAVKKSDIMYCTAYIKHISQFGDEGISQIPNDYIGKLWTMFAEKKFADNVVVVVLLKASSRNNEELHRQFLEELKKCGKLSEIYHSDSDVLLAAVSNISDKDVGLKYLILLKEMFVSDAEITEQKEKIFENVKKLYKSCESLKEKCELYKNYADFGSFGTQWKDFVSQEITIINVFDSFDEIGSGLSDEKIKKSAYWNIYVDKWFDSAFEELTKYYCQYEEGKPEEKETISKLCNSISKIWDFVSKEKQSAFKDISSKFNELYLLEDIKNANWFEKLPSVESLSSDVLKNEYYSKINEFIEKNQNITELSKYKGYLDTDDLKNAYNEKVLEFINKSSDIEELSKHKDYLDTDDLKNAYNGKVLEFINKSSDIEELSKHKDYLDTDDLKNAYNGKVLEFINKSSNIKELSKHKGYLDTDDLKNAYNGKVLEFINNSSDIEELSKHKGYLDTDDLKNAYNGKVLEFINNSSDIEELSKHKGYLDTDDLKNTYNGKVLEFINKSSDIEELSKCEDYLDTDDLRNAYNRKASEIWDSIDISEFEILYVRGVTNKSNNLYNCYRDFMDGNSLKSCKKKLTDISDEKEKKFLELPEILKKCANKASLKNYFYLADAFSHENTYRIVYDCVGSFDCTEIERELNDNNSDTFEKYIGYKTAKQYLQADDLDKNQIHVCVVYYVLLDESEKRDFLDKGKSYLKRLVSVQESCFTEEGLEWSFIQTVVEKTINFLEFYSENAWCLYERYKDDSIKEEIYNLSGEDGQKQIRENVKSMLLTRIAEPLSAEKGKDNQKNDWNFIKKSVGKVELQTFYSENAWFLYERYEDDSIKEEIYNLSGEDGQKQIKENVKSMLLTRIAEPLNDKESKEVQEGDWKFIKQSVENMELQTFYSENAWFLYERYEDDSIKEEIYNLSGEDGQKQIRENVKSMLLTRIAEPLNDKESEEVQEGDWKFIKQSVENMGLQTFYFDNVLCLYHRYASFGIKADIYRLVSESGKEQIQESIIQTFSDKTREELEAYYKTHISQKPENSYRKLVARLIYGRLLRLFDSESDREERIKIKERCKKIHSNYPQENSMIVYMEINTKSNFQRMSDSDSWFLDMQQKNGYFKLSYEEQRFFWKKAKEFADNCGSDKEYQALVNFQKRYEELRNSKKCKESLFYGDEYEKFRKSCKHMKATKYIADYKRNCILPDILYNTKVMREFLSLYDDEILNDAEMADFKNLMKDIAIAVNSGTISANDNNVSKEFLGQLNAKGIDLTSWGIDPNAWGIYVPGVSGNTAQSDNREPEVEKQITSSKEIYGNGGSCREVQKTANKNMEDFVQGFKNDEQYKSKKGIFGGKKK